MDTNNLIDNIIGELKPVKPLPLPIMRCVIWCGLAIIVTIFVVFTLGGIRHNIDSALSNTVFLIENTLIFIAGLSAVFATFKLCIPDTKIRRLPLFLLTLPVAIWVGVIVYSLIFSSSDALSHVFENDHGDGLHHCAIDLTFMTAIPLFALVSMIRKSSPVHLTWIGLSALLATLSFGALGMRILCAVDDPSHLLLWHFTPVIIYSVISIIAVRFLIRW